MPTPTVPRVSAMIDVVTTIRSARLPAALTPVPRTKKAIVSPASCQPVGEIPMTRAANDAANVATLASETTRVQM